MRNLLILFMICSVHLAGGQDKPNIVFIIADDIGWNDIGCYGNDVIHTPNMDRIAAEGLRFTNAYLTTSSCSPSRTSIISGRYPHNTGSAELHTPLPEDIEIFPEYLQKAGYHTAQAGKWHMGDAPRRGFDVIRDGRDDFGPGGEKMWVPVLRDRPRDKPFFIWLAALDAHRIWGPNVFKGTNDPAKIEVLPFLVDTDSTRKDLAQYYDEVTRFDHYIGEVEEELERQGVADNTILVIISDNGRPFPRCKTRMYDSGVKTPLIIKWPRGITSEGEVSNSMISTIDLGPTFLDLAGAEIPESIQGRSFKMLFDNPYEPFRNYIFAEHNWHDHEALERMVRTKDYMYILNLRPSYPNQGPADSNNGLSFADLMKQKEEGKLTAAQADVFIQPRPREELFDCQRDPMQLLNLASVPEMACKLTDLRQMMQLWIDQTGDTNPAHITPDWYSRTSGKALDIQRARGEMPGFSTHATEINHPGPF